MIRKLLKLTLKILTQRVLSRYRPTVIGITGSVGKTSAKEALYAVLYHNFFVRKTEGNKNNELGVPMTVLGIGPTFKSLMKGFWLAYGPRGRYPSLLILELGADRPDDIRYLADIVRPQIAVVTAVGETPVHVQFYPSVQAVAREKSHILNYLGSQGAAILNYDDPLVLRMQQGLKSKIITFGFSNHADLWASDMAYYLGDGNQQVAGLSFKIHHGDSFVPVRTHGLIGAHQIYSLLAAAAVGMHVGMNLVEIASALETLEPPAHRMTVLPGIKKSFVIDDTYNASPLSLQAALDTLKDFGNILGRRRLAVIGDMKELGSFEVQAHKKIGETIADKADYLVAVGELGEYIAETARPKMHESRVLTFATAAQAAPKVRELMQEGDIVLVKGSRAMKMELVIDEIKQKP